MRAGPLRKKITIETYTEAQDAFGEPVKTWVTHAASRWANVLPESGQEYFQGQQVMGRVATKFILRYTAGVKPKMRVVYGGEYYDIESVINIGERNRELHLMCSRITT